MLNIISSPFKVCLIACCLIYSVSGIVQPLTGRTFHNDRLITNIDSLDIALDKINLIINFGKNYLGKPYRYTVADGSILDCSGFVSYIHRCNGFDLPRSCTSLASLTEKISLSEIKKGDLMFFKGRDINSEKVGHVSMVTFVDGDVIEMMHSCNRGIIIEKYNSNSYYTSRLLFAGRLQ